MTMTMMAITSFSFIVEVVASPAQGSAELSGVEGGGGLWSLARLDWVEV